MFTNEQDTELMRQAREALENIKQVKELKSKTLLNEMTENWTRFDKSRKYYDEFDDLDYHGKVKVDMMYYEQLLQKLDDEHSEAVQEVVTNLYKDVYGIYQCINIKPEIYGKDISVKILEESIQNSNRLLSKVIYEFIDLNFYKLDPVQRAKKYSDTKTQAKQYIIEGATPEDAISLSIKTAVMENFLKNVAFPFTCWSRVKYLLEDEDYQAIFDKERLETLVESFEKNLNNIAKIVAVTI